MRSAPASRRIAVAHSGRLNASAMHYEAEQRRTVTRDPGAPAGGISQYHDGFGAKHGARCGKTGHRLSLTRRVGMTIYADHDTTAANRNRQDFGATESVWLFGYGSLIYKADFPYLERRRATLRGWARRLWQGSQDHRGTPAHPGRVATLVATADAVCVGAAYRIAPATFEQLDVREKNGYLREVVRLDFGGDAGADGVVYVAPPGNAAWLGPASDEAIARHIAGCAGPSGSNRDYVLRLATALQELDADDPHILAVVARLQALLVAG